MALRPLSLRASLPFVALVVIAACARVEQPPMTDARRAAIADTLKRMIVAAYDLSKPGDAVARLMSLYPVSGTVISASGGQVTTSRAALEAGVRAFWDNVGRNMRNPKWTWDTMHVDVLGPDAAVVTATYHVPHLTPRSEPHVIAGAWTAAFERRGGRWVIVQEHLSDLPQPPGMAMPGDTSASMAPMTGAMPAATPR
jgi:hypothetical protein